MESNNNYDFRGYDIPQVLQQISVGISKRFTIRGICDPVYICNSITLSTGKGDGQRFFYDTECFSLSEEQAYKAAKNLQNAYGCNISKFEVNELADIIRNGGVMPVRNIRRGLIDYLYRCNEEKQHCDSWRKDYLNGCIMEAQSNLQELKEYPDEGKVFYNADLSASSENGLSFIPSLYDERLNSYRSEEVEAGETEDLKLE